jgi:hypothetical protein
MDFGYFLKLGAIDFKDLAVAQAAPPSWLPRKRHAAWNYLWTYEPPTITAVARQHQREAWEKSVEGVPIPEEVAATPGTAYLLRSINYRESDNLVALKVVSIDRDGSVILIWKLLATFDTPVATGPEPNA